MPNPFEKLHEISFGTEPWADAASHRRSDYVNEEWKTKYGQDKISFGKFTVTTSRLEDDELVPWKRTTESNQQQSLYNKMKYILPLAQPETYFKDLTEETYFPDNNEWVPFFETRNTISLSINFGLEAKTKSSAEGDSVLTLIYQTYDPGSGEWINNYKQEFTFTNLATSTKKEVENTENIIIYPNPNSGVLNVSLKNVNGLSRVSMVNAVGQTVFTKRFDGFSGNTVFTEDLSYLKKGIYFVQVFSEGGMLSKKLILQ